MNRPRFPTVEWEIKQTKHLLAQVSEREHDVKSECWCCCIQCSRRLATR